MTMATPATHARGRRGADLDGPSVEALLVDLRPLVVRTVRLVVGAGSVVAEDAAQEALLAVAQSLPSLENTRAAPAWAARIATRVALRVAKREARLGLLGVRALRPADAVSQEPPDLLELKDAFDRLPPRQRATAVLRLFVGLTEQETADALECSIGTVKRQLHEARRELGRRLR
jgi:RNA polymerase sigma factor (sigma-70 family)